MSYDLGTADVVSHCDYILDCMTTGPDQQLIHKIEAFACKWLHHSAQCSEAESLFADFMAGSRSETVELIPDHARALELARTLAKFNVYTTHLLICEICQKKSQAEQNLSDRKEVCA